MSEEQEPFLMDDMIADNEDDCMIACCEKMWIYYMKRKNHQKSNILKIHREALYDQVQFCPFCGESLYRIGKIYSDCFKDDMVDIIYTKPS